MLLNGKLGYSFLFLIKLNEVNLSEKFRYKGIIFNLTYFSDVLFEQNELEYNFELRNKPDHCILHALLVMKGNLN